MDFNKKYNRIKSLVSEDFEILENDIKSLFLENNPLQKDLLEFLTNNAKRLRPLVGLLFLRSIFGKVNQKQIDALLAVELIHNATLIHDDIIDNAKTRRKHETLNIKFDNNLAVIAGDYLLSIAMEKIINTNSADVIKICTQALKSVCVGEINQYFNKFKITSIEDYIEKSKQKTALLFKIGIKSGLLLADDTINVDIFDIATKFSENFGIAFQIRDDLINITENTSKSLDLESGIYNAPIIFAYEENKDIMKSDNLISALKKTKGIEKTKNLMDNYFDSSISTIESLSNNVYKSALIELVETFRCCS